MYAALVGPPILRFKKLHPRAHAPAYMSEGAAGADVSACLDHAIVLAPRERAAIPTGLALEVPSGYYVRISPRSGLALRDGIDVLAGVVDSDFRGEVQVILVNHGQVPFTVSCSMRIAQLVVLPVARADFYDVGAKDLTPSLRGTGMLGSTGR